jgi:hypothetical protein
MNFRQRLNGENGNCLLIIIVILLILIATKMGAC